MYRFLGLAGLLVLAGCPEPVPPPPPPPPPPVKHWQVVIVYETNDLDNYSRGQQVLIGSLVFRENLAAAGHVLVAGGVVDQDVEDEAGNVPQGLAPYLQPAKGKQLPRLCIAAEVGAEVLDFLLPETEAAVFDLLEAEAHK